MGVLLHAFVNIYVNEISKEIYQCLPKRNDFVDIYL